MSSERRIKRLSDGVGALNSAPPTVWYPPAGYEYRDDPVAFVRERLGGESETRRSDGSPYQFDVLRSLAANDSVVVRSAHGCGKSVTLAWAALWWLTTRPEGLVIVLAPTLKRQAEGVLGDHIAYWAEQGRITLRSDGFAIRHDANRSRLVMLSGASEVGNIEGLHADSVLVIYEEAKSLTKETLEAVAGAMTGKESKELMASTPGAAVGAFYDACTKQDAGWERFHVSALDSSRVSDSWITKHTKRWGTNSPVYKMRLLGEFVVDGSGQLFPWTLLHAARENAEPVLPPSRARYRITTMGVDVARSLSGDASAVLVVKDGEVLHRETWHEADLMASAARVAALAVRFAPHRIRVDVGGPGGGLADRLAQLGHPVEHVYFGGAATENQSFVNWRAEAYFTLKRRLDERSLSLPDDHDSDEMLEELAVLSILTDRSGRLQLISKDAVRSQIGRSPDYADALALAVAEGDPNLPTRAPVSLSVGPATFFSQGHAIHHTNPDGLPPSGDPVLRMQKAWRERQAS